MLTPLLLAALATAASMPGAPNDALLKMRTQAHLQASPASVSTAAHAVHLFPSAAGIGLQGGETAPTATPAAAASPHASSAFNRSKAGPEAGPGNLSLMGLVLLLAGGVIFLIWKSKQNKGDASTDIHIVASTALGPKRSLFVVDLGHHRFFLGACDGGVSLLHREERPLEEHSAFEASFGPSFEASFGESLEDVELKAKLANTQELLA